MVASSLVVSYSKLDAAVFEDERARRQKEQRGETNLN